MPYTMQLILLGFGISQVAAYATRTYMHGQLAHSTVIFCKAEEFVMRFIVWFTIGMRPWEWAFVHDKLHHPNSDEPEDPHSPYHHSLFTVTFGMFFLFKRAIKENQEYLKEYEEDFGLKWFDRKVFRHGTIGVALGITLAIVLFGWYGGTVIAVSHAGFYLLYGGIINGLGHKGWGYKNYPAISGLNYRFLAPFIMFEPLHNNHHERPWSARFSRSRSEGGRWGEIDLVWWSLRLQRRLGLCKIPELDKIKVI